MFDSQGRVAGSRRLRATLTRKVAKQTATTLYHMHRTGVVHGGKAFPTSQTCQFPTMIHSLSDLSHLTTSDIFVPPITHVIGWSDAIWAIQRRKVLQLATEYLLALTLQPCSWRLTRMIIYRTHFFKKAPSLGILGSPTNLEHC